VLDLLRFEEDFGCSNVSSMCNAARLSLLLKRSSRVRSERHDVVRVAPTGQWQLIKTSVDTYVVPKLSSSMSLLPAIEVTVPPARFPSGYVDGVRPSHHKNNTKTKFANPWQSFRLVAVDVYSSLLNLCRFQTFFQLLSVRYITRDTLVSNKAFTHRVTHLVRV
jgi:hypothetical protein